MSRSLRRTINSMKKGTSKKYPNNSNLSFYESGKRIGKSCFSNKRMFSNENRALEALRLQRTFGARVCRVYKCNLCGRWHLTSTSRRDEQERHVPKEEKYHRNGKYEIKGYRGSCGWTFDSTY